MSAAVLSLRSSLSRATVLPLVLVLLLATGGGVWAAGFEVIGAATRL